MTSVGSQFRVWSPPLRRASILATAALAVTGAMTLAGPASAQTPPGQGGGPRHLSWPGRGEAAMPASEPPAVTPVRRDLRRPNTPIPHGGFARSEPEPARPGLTPAPGPVRHALTPANAWMQRPAAPPEAAPEPAPEPVMAEALPPPPPARRPAPAPEMTAAADPMAPRRDAPVFHMQQSPPPAAAQYLTDRSGQPAPAEAVLPPVAAPGSEMTASADPMAPRRDAPIFHMQQTPPPAAAPEQAAPEAREPAQAGRDAPRVRRVAEVVNTGERPPQQGARYYSVHRQNGRQPDALAMPAPTYVDALAITMTDTPASQDLAQPDQGPTLIRDNQGRMRAAPAASDGDHQ